MEQIFLGNGSDEAIDLAYRCFCEPGIDNVVAIEPTYGMYRVCADINNVANLLNSEWGTYKQLASQTVLEYKDGVYTFNKPKWNVYSDLLSAWQVLLHVRYSF